MVSIYGILRFICIIFNICCIMLIGVIFVRSRFFSDFFSRVLRWVVILVSFGIMFFKCIFLMILLFLDIFDVVLFRILFIFV